MKISNSFIAHSDGKDTLLVSTGTSDFSGLVRSNASAGFIIKCLEKDTTENEIVEAMIKEFDAPREIIERDVKKIVAQLRKIGAIEG